ncbi:MAG TPA: Eco57I restriction-modification methylase domain-containing protein, partial [Candidatus Acidoferrales bacterium]|nr:Eco57I restriction-modification methylase domain-containing protein [Candidatus Acidoferrales bacterium]
FVVTKDAPQRVRKMLALDATEGIDDETRNALKEILTPEEAALLLDRLFELRACDPAVGSGAFPMGLLHELVNLARLCATRAAGKDPVLGERSWLYNTKKRIIERVIYGVDNQSQAVDICKLRLWLSLMVDYELSADPDNCEATSFRKALKEIEPLPNLDFKIRRANSLVDYIHGEPVELKQLSSESGAALALSKLSTAKREFFNARTAGAKRKLRLDIYENITELAKIELTRARTDAAGLGFTLDDRDAERVAELDNGLKQLGFTTAQVRAARKMRAQEQEDALERIRAQFDDPDKPTFVWQLDFAEVFHRDETPQSDSSLPTDKSDNKGTTTRNGFDLAIGNPPYIRIQTLTKSDPKLAAYYKQRYQSAAMGNYDLYVCFVERGLELLHENGQLAYIQPHKFFNAQYGEPLRALLARGKHLRHVVHFGDQQIFPGATNYVCLLFLAKGGVAQCRFVKVDSLDNWLATLEGTEATILAAKIGEAEWNFIVGKGADLFERLHKIPVKLEHVTNRIFQGVKTSADKIYIVEELNRTKISVRVFSPHTKKEHELEPNLLHPLIKGGDSKAFAMSRTKRLILFPYEKASDGDSALIPSSAIKKRFPLTWAYLEENRDYLAGREDGRMKHDGWYGYIYPKALDVMPLPKIFTPDISPRAAFSYDSTGEVFFTGGVAGGYGLLPKPPMCAELLLGILNSTVLDFYHHRVASQMRGGWFSYESRFIKNLPIASSLPAQKPVLIRLSEWLLWLHAQSRQSESTRKNPNDALMTAYFEQWMNALVYELYFPTELHDANLHFFDLIQAEAPPPLEKLPEADRFPRLRKLFQTTYASDHKLRQALYRLGSLDVVRIIEGKA